MEKLDIDGKVWKSLLQQLPIGLLPILCLLSGTVFAQDRPDSSSRPANVTGIPSASSRTYSPDDAAAAVDDQLSSSNPQVTSIDQLPAAQPISPDASSGNSIRLSLRGAVQLALSQNPQEIAARIRIDEQRRKQDEARSAFLPQAAVASNASVVRFNEQSVLAVEAPARIGPYQLLNAGGVFSQDVLDVVAIRRYQASKEHVRTSVDVLTVTREEIVSVVVTAYLSILRAKATLDAAHAQRQLAQRLFDQAGQLQKNGVGTNLDKLRANVELQNEIQREIDATSLVHTTSFALAELLSLPQGQEVETADSMEFAQTVPLDENLLIQQALAHRPEILAISSELRAAQIEHKEAGDQRLPSVQFLGSFYEQGRVFSQVIPSYTYTGVLSIPIFTGGRISSEVAYARLEEKRVSEQKRETEDKVLQQVRTATDNLRASSTAVTVANHALDLAQQEVAQAQRRFAAGVSTNIEVITAQDELARASDNQIDALYRFNQSRADLARATGNAEDVYGR